MPRNYMASAQYLIIDIQMNNAAFADEPMTEAARILRELATRLEREGPPSRDDFGGLFDLNGNLVGTVKVIARRER